MNPMQRLTMIVWTFPQAASEIAVKDGLRAIDNVELPPVHFETDKSSNRVKVGVIDANKSIAIFLPA